ncbi:MAG: 30S ribosomal protein S8e [Candidatus Helarchaeota archaeon]
MGRWQGRSKRLATGARVRFSRKKRLFEMGRPPAETVLGPRKLKIERVRGGNRKLRVYIENTINVSNQSTGRTELVKIEEVLSNPANVEYTRRRIITKGAIVSTKLGKVRVTSRPGQHGIINGILIQE